MAFTFEHVWQLVLTVAAVVLGWLHVLRREEVAEMKAAIARAENRAQAAERALSEHKLFAAENFAKKPDVDRAIEKLEERISKQLADQGEAQLERLEEIRDRLPRRT
ncbi:MAG: hypothetical protein ACK4X1_14635 [Terricaulis sp.]